MSSFGSVRPSIRSRGFDFLASEDARPEKDACSRGRVGAI